MFDCDTYLKNCLQNQTLPNVLLLVGDQGEEIARNLATQLLGCTEKKLTTHADFQIFRPEGKSGQHSIESMRHLIDRVYSAPFEAEKKVFLIHDVERMQPAASNALLKTLEEPLLDTHLLLLAADARQILPTIISRATQLHLESRQTAESIDFSKISEEITRIGKEIDEMEDPVLQSRRFENLLMSLLMWARDAQAKEAKVPEERLFFPKAVSPERPISLEKMEEALLRARLGFKRHISIAACLQQILIQVL